MRLKSVTLNNFRCFEHLHIDLHPRLTVFVGANGAGKTALMDGIATAFTPMLSYLSSANQRLKGRGIKDSDFRIEPLPASSGKSRWGKADYVQIVAKTEEGLVWDYSKRADSGAIRPPVKHGEKALKDYLDQLMSSYKDGQSQLTPVVAYYGSGRGFIEFPGHTRSAKDENYSHPTSALLGALEAKSDFREMMTWFDQEESSELRANKGIINEHFVESPVLEAVRSAVSSLLNPSYNNPHFNQYHKFTVTRVCDNAPLLVSQLSQGYQSMLALGIDFTRRLGIANIGWSGFNRQEPNQFIDDVIAPAISMNVGFSFESITAVTPILATPAIMLIDEIDLHLHPSWQQRVLDDLMRTFPLTQFIVTTHSPQVLTSVDAACIRKLEQHTDPDTGVVRTVLSTVTQQTRGVASADVLAEIMGVDPIPDVPEARDLSAYHGLIQQNLHESDDGQALRHKLDAHFGPDHPVMLDCNRMIRLQAFKQKLPLAAARSA